MPPVLRARAAHPEPAGRTAPSDAASDPFLDPRQFAAMLRAARRILTSDDLARDVVQEVLVDLWSRDSLERTSPRALRFLVRCASLHALRTLERRRHHEQAAPSRARDDDDPLERAALEELHARLEQGLRALEPSHRRVLELAAIDGLGYREIARRLDVAVGTVRSRLHRARATAARTRRFGEPRSVERHPSRDHHGPSTPRLRAPTDMNLRSTRKTLLLACGSLAGASLVVAAGELDGELPIAFVIDTVNDTVYRLIDFDTLPQGADGNWNSNNGPLPDAHPFYDANHILATISLSEPISITASNDDFLYVGDAGEHIVLRLEDLDWPVGGEDGACYDLHPSDPCLHEHALYFDGKPGGNGSGIVMSTPNDLTTIELGVLWVASAGDALLGAEDAILRLEDGNGDCDANDAAEATVFFAPAPGNPDQAFSIPTGIAVVIEHEDHREREEEVQAVYYLESGSGIPKGVWRLVDHNGSGVAGDQAPGAEEEVEHFWPLTQADLVAEGVASPLPSRAAAAPRVGRPRTRAEQAPGRVTEESAAAAGAADRGGGNGAPMLHALGPEDRPAILRASAFGPRTSGRSRRWGVAARSRRAPESSWPIGSLALLAIGSGGKAAAAARGTPPCPGVLPAPCDPGMGHCATARSAERPKGCPAAHPPARRALDAAFGRGGWTHEHLLPRARSRRMSNRSTLLSLPILMGLSACAAFTKQSVGLQQADGLVGHIQRVHVDCELAQERLREAVTQLERIADPKFTGDALRAHAELVSSIERSERQAGALRKSLDPLKAAAEPFFHRWASELASFQNMELRKRSRRRLTETQGRYESIVAATEPALAGCEYINRGLRDHALFLEHDFNAASRAEIASDVETLALMAHKLDERFDACLESCRAYIESSAPPVEPESAPRPAKGGTSTTVRHGG